MEDALKDLNADIKDLEEHKLTDILNEERINKVVLDDLEIGTSVVYRGSCTKSDQKRAFQFLFDSNNEGALKQYAIIDIAACPMAEAVLEDNFIPYTVEYSIHHATLSSILKEMAESGQLSTDDIDRYNIYIQPQVKVKKIN